MILEGAQAMTNGELLSIMLGSGVRGRPVQEVAQALLNVASGDLAVLSKMPPQGYTSVEGIGMAKAVQIQQLWSWVGGVRSRLKEKKPLRLSVVPKIFTAGFH